MHLKAEIEAGLVTVPETEKIMDVNKNTNENGKKVFKNGKLAVMVQKRASDISQGSVAARLRYGEIVNDSFIAYFLTSPTV